MLGAIAAAQAPGTGYINVSIYPSATTSGCLADNGQWTDNTAIPCGTFTLDDAGSPSTSLGPCEWLFDEPGGQVSFACPGSGGIDFDFIVCKST